MAENFEFDSDNWRINTSQLSCAPQTFGNESAYGRSNQVGYRRNNMWRGTVTLNPLRDFVRVDFEGWLAGLDGARNTFDLELCDPFQLKLEGKSIEGQLELLGYEVQNLCGPNGDGEYGLPFSDGTCFSDGTGFYIPLFSAASATIGASEGATSMDIGAGANTLRRGSKFSTSDKYCHIITKIEGSVVHFRPHLRRDIAAGEPLETQRPKIRVRLAEDNSGTPSVKYGRYTDEITLDVVEALKR